MSFIEKFKSSRRGYYSLWIFAIIFLLSIFAEFIANDKPIVVISPEKIYFPIFKAYTELDFGGELPTKINYQDKYMQELMAQHSAKIIWPLIRFSYNTIYYDLGVPAPSPPSSVHWLGTDDSGRDVAAWVIYSLRISIFFAISLALLTVIIALLVGTIQGYFGGLIDLFMQRIVEIWHSLPIMFLLIILSSVTVPNFWWLLVIFLLFNWVYLSQLVRAEVLKVRKLDYIKAAKALGAPPATIIARHIIPSAMVSVFAFFSVFDVQCNSHAHFA